MRAPVRGIEIEGERVREYFWMAEVLRADYFISALPREALLELLPAAIVGNTPVFSGLRNLRNSPITSVHLWFDRSVMSEPFITLLDTTTQWIFNKSLLSAESKSGSPASWSERPGTIFAARDQRVVRFGFAIAPGNYCEMLGRDCTDTSSDARREGFEGDGDQGNCGDIFS